MDRATAHRKWHALGRMTIEHGCTPAEEWTARRLRARLAAKWGFEREPARRTNRLDRDVANFYRAERAAARRWRWEYRSCGKPRCRCMRRGQRHGPYKYAKQRDGATVRSVYLGR
jgi:hypothetical protein